MLAAILCGLLLILKINLAVSQCNHGDVRLIGGTGDYEGNVQLCKNGIWGYVCYSSWSSNDAKVLCRQLGFSASSAYYRGGSSYYGFGNGTVWLERLLCHGNESELIECPTGIDSSCNNAYAIAGVFCGSGMNCTNGTVRLAIASNGISYGRSEGEVQVCYNNQWGSVCGNGWSTTAATLVCKQLGYTSYIEYKLNYNFPNIVWPTWFDNVTCSNFSTSLFDCQREILNGTCDGIGVICSATDSSSCVSDTVKLWSAYDSTPDNEGIPLVCISGNWYPIFDSSTCYSLNLACEAAGYDGLEYYEIDAGRYYGYSYTDHYRFLCSISSTNLFGCSKSLYSYPIAWYRSCGVKCFESETASCSSEGSFQLVNGTSSNEGRVEYCYKNHWTPMCSINSYTANIICKELGYRPNTLIFSNNEFGKLDMSGNFRYLQCSNTNIDPSQCTVIQRSSCIDSTPCYTHSGVRCYELTNECVNGGVRLVDGNIEQEGRVEVCVDGIWGQICGSGWDINDAYVACVGLGYTGNANPTFYQYSTKFGVGYGPIVWGNVNCYYWNNDIHDCSKIVIQLYSTFSCSTNHIAGVRCTEGCSDGDVRLVGGSSIHEGTVEICYDELWGLISDDGWSDSNAVVICRQLGFTGEGVKSIAASFYGKPKKTIHLKKVNCSSHENTLLACNNTQLSVDVGITLTSSTDVAGVNCQPSPSTCLSMFESCSKNGSVRLVDNESNDEGLVEYCTGGTFWTPLCNIDNKAATVICRQLGYTPYSWGSIILNKDDKPYSLIEGISCSGEESNLIECNNNSIGLSTVSNGCVQCSEHSIGLRCFNSIITDSCDEGLVRLVDGPSDREGRVEVCVNGVWGSVCDNGWDSTDGFIVCQQLGYTREEPFIYSNSYFGDGSYPVVYSNIKCKGWEDSISDCDKDGYLSYTCYPGHTAGLKCNGEYVNAEVAGNSKPATNSGGSSDVITDNSTAGSDAVTGDSTRSSHVIIHNSGGSSDVIDNSIRSSDVATDDSTISSHVIIDNSGGSSDVIIGVISSLFMIVFVIFSVALLALFFVMKKRSRQPATVPFPYSTPATTHNKDDIQMKPCPVYEELS